MGEAKLVREDESLHFTQKQALQLSHKYLKILFSKRNVIQANICHFWVARVVLENAMCPHGKPTMQC